MRTFYSLFIPVCLTQFFDPWCIGTYSIETLHAYKMDIQPFQGVFSNFIFVFVIIILFGTRLISFILFFRFLWIVLFPFLFRPSCNHLIYTFRHLYIPSLSFEQFFLTITRVVLNKFNLTVLNTKFIQIHWLYLLRLLPSVQKSCSKSCCFGAPLRAKIVL